MWAWNGKHPKIRCIRNQTHRQISDAQPHLGVLLHKHSPEYVGHGDGDDDDENRRRCLGQSRRFRGRRCFSLDETVVKDNVCCRTSRGSFDRQKSAASSTIHDMITREPESRKAPTSARTRPADFEVTSHNYIARFADADKMAEHDPKYRTPKVCLLWRNTLLELKDGQCLIFGESERKF